MSDIDYDKVAAITGEVDAQALQSAIVDGINIYCRDVLEPRGILNKDKDDDHAGSQQNADKYSIALRVALAIMGRVDDLAWRKPFPSEITK